ELSNEATLAPAAANTGACWPPPDARQSTSTPSILSGNHSRGTGFTGVSTTLQFPRRASAIVTLSTGTLHSLVSAVMSHALLLKPATSILFRPIASKDRGQRQRDYPQV